MNHALHMNKASSAQAMRGVSVFASKSKRSAAYACRIDAIQNIDKREQSFWQFYTPNCFNPISIPG